MKKSLVSWLIIFGCLILLLIVGSILGIWKYVIYLPPLWERLIALPAATPAEAYEKFQEQLKKGNDKSSLRYISREKRKQYEKMLQNSEIRQQYISPLSNLRESYHLECENKHICNIVAIYVYDYEVTKSYWENISGKDFLVPAGIKKLEMTFVEIKPGYWQIHEL